MNFFPEPSTTVMYSFRVPLPPNFVNPARNGVGPKAWAMKASQKKAYTKSAVALIRSQFQPVPTFKAAAYRAHLVVPGRRDLDNLVALLKWPQDALKEVGMVRNDTEKHLRLDAIPTQEAVAVGLHRTKGEDLGVYTARRLRVLAQCRIDIVIWERTDGN